MLYILFMASYDQHTFGYYTLKYTIHLDCDSCNEQLIGLAINNVQVQLLQLGFCFKFSKLGSQNELFTQNDRL